jgi:hypothetical protein
MALVARVRWAPGCKDAGSPDSRAIGATEDAAAGMPSADARHSLYFAEPSPRSPGSPRADHSLHEPG